MIVVETNRLLIKKFTTNDAAFFLKLANTPNWIKYIGDRNLKTTNQAKDYLINGTLKSYSENGFGFYKLLLKDANLKAIGTCGLVKRAYLEHVDIGFAMLPEYENKGFGYESSVAILNLAKQQFHLDNILAITQSNNSNSIKLLEKLGLSYEKTIKPFVDDDELLLFAKNLT